MEKDIRPPGIRIFLVRHGETEWNRIHRFQGRSDIPLNRKGKEQARALAQALKEKTITAIYSSPLIRSLETARHIKKFHPSSPLFQEEGLLEMDLGKFEGMEAQRWIIEYPEFRRIWEKNPASMTMPGGESLQEVQSRAVEALDNILQHYAPESTVVICTHNFVIIAILCHAMQISFDRFRECGQETAAMNVLYKDGERFQVTVVNDRSHLKKDNG